MLHNTELILNTIYGYIQRWKYEDTEVGEMGDVPEQSGPKSWGGGFCAPFRGAGSPSKTMSPGPRPTSVPSGILIHAAVWPQQTSAKNWGLCPFWGGGVGSPSIAMWHPDASNRLTTIHQRHTETDNGPIA